MPRTSGHWPTFVKVEVCELQPVLTLEDVLRNDVQADVELVCHEVEELRAWAEEINDHGVRVDFLDGLDVALDLGTAAKTGVVLQVVEGVSNVVRTKWLAVAPSDALAKINRQLGKVSAVIPRLREPRVFLVVER